ncbi:MAG TPA: DUF503 domain-containing protein [Capsulimonadaceae bacterium]|jgi:hypothetical protein
MHIGSLTVTLAIPGAQSLKDKRHVVRGLLESVRGKFNVSAAEVGELDLWQRATLAFVVVANEASFVDKVLAKVVDTIESEPECNVLQIDQEQL